jgi:hypothetical protein
VEAVKDPGEGMLKVSLSPVAKKFPEGSRARSWIVPLTPTVFTKGFPDIVVNVT